MTVERFDVVCAGVIYLDLTFAGLESAGVACRGPISERSAVTAVLPVDGDRALVSHLPEEVAATPLDVSELYPRAVVKLIDQTVHARAGTCVYAVCSHADATAAAHGALFDVSGCRAVITNRAEALALTGQSTPEAAALSLAERTSTAVVTLGALGALAACDRQLTRAPAPAADVRHTTGGGDLFAAAYVWADLAGYDLPDRLRLSTAYATRSLSSLTAFVGAATLANITSAVREMGLHP